MSKKSPLDWNRKATLKDALSHGLRETEFQAVCTALGRDINMTELGICSALFSEHCSYKSTKRLLKTLPTKGTRVIHGPGENAGVIDIGDNQAVVFKVESHNHPTFIEPFQGAATGVGGILRDVFTMGARPLALLNSIRFGDPTLPKSRYLLKNSVKGIGFYGNCMGIPTVGGETFFHAAYNGNCLVNAFALGLVEHDHIFLGKAAGVGNAVIYVGSKTGRDGIHGASMSSESFDDDSDEKRPTVQVGDPFQEKLLLEACLEAMRSGAVVGIQDMGAAGLTSSSYEMADRGGTGVRLHLDRVPQRETEMNPYEIMLSESQERMLLIAESGREKEIMDIFHHWEMDAVVVGEVIDGGNVELFWNGEMFSTIPAHVFTSTVPQYDWPTKEPAERKANLSFDPLSVPAPQDLDKTWMTFLGNPNICSRRLIYSQYDSTVRSNTVVHPGSDSGMIRIKRTGNAEKGVSISLDCNAIYCSIDPAAGTALSLAEGIRNVTATGAEAIGISDCLNMPSPEKPESMWQISECIRGLGTAAHEFGIPIVSGNVSLYNETNGSGILPTPLLAVVGLIPDAKRAISAQFKSTNDSVLVIGSTEETEIGGSAYLSAIHKLEKGALPRLDYGKETRTNQLIRELISEGLLKSCHDLSDGGLASGLPECCFRADGKHIGASLKPEQKVLRKDAFLFSESAARYVVSCDSKHEDTVRKRINSAGLVVGLSGRTGGSVIQIDGVSSLSIEAAFRVWNDGLDDLFEH